MRIRSDGAVFMVFGHRIEGMPVRGVLPVAATGRQRTVDAPEALGRSAEEPYGDGGSIQMEAADRPEKFG